MSHLKAILLCKLDDGFPPLPGGVCSIEHLFNTEEKTDERFVFFPGPHDVSDLPETSRRLTATWPPSSVRYCRTSFNAAEAHCLKRPQVNLGGQITNGCWLNELLRPVAALLPSDL